MTRPTSGSVDDPARRWCQLTYTSFDNGSGTGGGWQVKDTSGHVSESERELMSAFVSARFDVEPRLPQFPTPSDIVGRPSRLMYALADGLAGYWHSADAGVDGSGRPGNVFTHVLLDRHTRSLTVAPRPIDLWMSPLWLRPYGSGEVLGARPGEIEQPPAGSAITRRSVIDFVLGSMERNSFLQILLDAVLHAMSGGPAIALLVTGWDEAAQWIGAVSYFMSPNKSREFSWSTYEHHASLAEGLRRGVLLAAVVDYEPALPLDQHYVALDPHQTVQLGLLGGTRHSSGNASVPVSRWSMIAQEVLRDAETAESILAEQDSVAVEVEDVDLHPSWPLAVAVVRSGSVESADAARVVGEYAPTHVYRSPLLAELVRSNRLASAPDNAADAWAMLHVAISEAREADYLVRQYVECALRDPEWLFGTDRPPPLLAQLMVEPQDAEGAVLASMDAQLQRARLITSASDADRVIFEVVRVAELVFSTLAIGRSSITIEPLAEALERVGVDGVFDTFRARSLIDALGPVSEPVLSGLLRPAVERSAVFQERPFGRRLSAPVLHWLCPTPDADASQTVSLRKQLSSMVLDEYLFAVLTTSRRDFRLYAAAMPFAGLVIRASVAAGEPDDWLREKVATIAMETKFPTPAALGVFVDFGVRTPPAIALGAMVFSPWTSNLEGLCNHVLLQSDRYLSDTSPEKADDRLAVSAAKLRSIQEWSAMTPASVVSLVDNQLRVFLENVQHLPGHEVPQDLQSTLSALYVAAQSLDRAWVGTSPADGRCATRPAPRNVTAILADLAMTGTVDIRWIVAKSFLSRLTSGAAISTRVVLGPSNSIDLQQNLLDDVVGLLVESGRYAGPRSIEELRDAIWPDVQQMTAVRAEEIFVNYRDGANVWLRSFRILNEQRSF